MSKCSPIFKHIYPLDYKIIMFKVEEQVLVALPRAEISSLSNFQKNMPLLFGGGSFFYGNRLS